MRQRNKRKEHELNAKEDSIQAAVLNLKAKERELVQRENDLNEKIKTYKRREK